MKQAKKFTAALLCGTVLLAAIPVPAVTAADDPAAAEPAVMDCVVTMDGTTATATNDKVKIEGGKITISASGSYEFTGKLDDGQIYVNIADEAADPGTVKLFLNNATITGKTDAAILIENAENTSINILDGTENFIYDGATYPEKVTAAIYAKDDLTIKSGGENGDGKLRIEAMTQDAVHCNNDLKITGGTLKVKTEQGDGLRGKTSVEIKGGKVDVNADGDGIKSTKGKVEISGGKIEIKAGNDAVQGETSVLISGGDLKANGDRGLTNTAGKVTITGGEIFATATVDTPKEGTEAKDNTFKIDEKSTQPVMLLKMSEQQVKEQRVVLKNQASASEIINKNPNKKFDYILISAPTMKVGDTYEISINEVVCENGAIEQKELITSAENVVNTAPHVVKEDDPLDVNLDGNVDVSDPVLLLRYVAADKGVSPTDAMVKRMDTDGNGNVETADADLILKRIARIA